MERIIAGPGVYICDECIKVCNNILEDDNYENNEVAYTINDEDKLLSPQEIKEILGHVKLDTTLIYAKVSKENIKHDHRKYII